MARWPGQISLEAIQESFREVWGALQPFLSGSPDLKGRRFSNAGDAIQPHEFLTLGQGDIRYEAKKPPELPGLPEPEVDEKAVRIDAYANRGGAYVFPNTIFEASDRNYVAWVSDGVNWIYAYGIHQRTQSQLAALAATLGTSDAGYLVNVTDFGWVLQWTGSAWAFGAGQTGGGFIQGFSAAPLAGAWQVCDGTATTFLKADGTTGNFTTPNLTGHYVKLNNAGYTGTVVAGGVSGATSAGTPTGTIGNNSASQEVQSGTGITVAANPHTHTFTGDLMGTHTHTPGTLELARTELIPYFRR